MSAVPSQPQLRLPFTGCGVLFTDLDGTLLDHDTYRPSRAARAVVDRLARDGVLTIPVTSKTAAEVLVLAETVGFAPVAVVEGGAALLLEDGSTRILGARREDLIRVLRGMRERGWALRGFADMTSGEVAAMAGLARAAADRAMERLASEPFVIDPPTPSDLEPLHVRAVELGASVTRGGRFWHLLGAGVDKGTGVEAVLDALTEDARPITGAVGDAWNDLPMFDRVDHPYFLGSRLSPEELPRRVQRIPEQGPDGFVKAALDFLAVCLRRPAR